VWAAQGNAFAALAEYAWPRGWGLGEEVLPNCHDEGEECKTVVKAVMTELGRLPPVLTEQAASVIDSVDAVVERTVRSLPRVIAAMTKILDRTAANPGEAAIAFADSPTELAPFNELTLGPRKSSGKAKAPPAPNGGAAKPGEPAPPAPIS
jgi:hypothetical protein